MKLIIAIVQDQDASNLINDLTDNEYSVTKLASTGGFLRSGNTTLLIGVEDESVDDLLNIINDNSKTRNMTTSIMNMNMPGDSYVPYPLEVRIGGATIFILDIEKHIRI